MIPVASRTVNDDHTRAFARALRARNLSPRTIASYLESAEALRSHLDGTPLDQAGRDDIQGFIATQLDRFSPATAAIRFRSLQQFYRWAEDEGICESPMRGLRPPAVPDTPVAVLTLNQIKELLGTCSGQTFADRRDIAMIRLFLEPGGLRLSEMTGLDLAGLDLQADEVTVLGKGRRSRRVPFGPKTGMAIERYVRIRGGHPWARLPSLWLGSKGALTTSGVSQMMRRRAVLAGIPHLHPHMLRHTAAHDWLSAGGQETDAMRLFGWRSREMLSRYGASAAAERARDAARKFQLGDRY